LRKKIRGGEHGAWSMEQEAQGSGRRAQGKKCRDDGIGLRVEREPYLTSTSTLTLLIEVPGFDQLIIASADRDRLGDADEIHIGGVARSLGALYVVEIDY
jgi:hypothetical protein